MAELRAERPTIRSRLADLVAKAVTPIAVDERHAYRVGNRAAQAMDWVPFLGGAMGAQEGAQQAQRGYRSGSLADLIIGAGGAALSVIPGVGSKGGKVIGAGRKLPGVNDNNGLPDAMNSLASFLKDKRPIHQMYQQGDVLVHRGVVGEVVGATDSAVVLQTQNGRIIVPRNDPDLEVAPYKQW